MGYTSDRNPIFLRCRKRRMAQALRLWNNLDGLHVLLLAAVDVPTMCPQSSNVVADPGPLPFSSQPMNGQLLTATRLSRCPQPPSIPPRNPLRLRPASVDDNYKPQPIISSLRMRIVHSQSLPFLDTAKAITAQANETLNVDDKSRQKSLSESPMTTPLSPVDTIDDADSSTGSSTTSTTMPCPHLPRRPR